MFQHDRTLEDATTFSRFDPEEPLSTFSPHPIFLEEKQWPTVEHYFQYHLVANPAVANQVYEVTRPIQAYRLGTAWFRRKRRDWRKVRCVIMTRGLYTKCMMYPSVKERLLATGDTLLVETSAYDHYWGLGRDQRGQNMLGKVWMDIRKKLREDTTHPTA